MLMIVRRFRGRSRLLLAGRRGIEIGIEDRSDRAGGQHPKSAASGASGKRPNPRCNNYRRERRSSFVFIVCTLLCCSVFLSQQGVRYLQLRIHSTASSSQRSRRMCGRRRDHAGTRRTWHGTGKLSALSHTSPGLPSGGQGRSSGACIWLAGSSANRGQQLSSARSEQRGPKHL